MTVRSSRLDYVRLCKESSWGTLPGTPTWHYWPSTARGLKYELAKMFPEGTVGDNDLDQQSLVGRQRGEGRLEGDFYADPLGLLLLAAIGSVTTTEGASGATTYKKHTYSWADTPPSLSIEQFKGLYTGSATNVEQFLGMGVQRLSLSWAPGEDDSILGVSVDLIGKAPGKAATASFTKPTYRPLPGWKGECDLGGADFERVVDFELNIETGCVLTKAGAGSQDPQGIAFGGRSVRGSATFLFEDDDEYDDWISDTTREWILDLKGVDVVETVTTVDYYENLVITLSDLDIADHEPDDSGDFVVARIDFRSLDDSTNGIGKFELYNAVASY